MSAGKIFIFLLLFMVACHQRDQEKPITQIARAYFDAYKERSDFDHFLSFYTDDVVLEDMISGDRTVGKLELASFFDWENPSFSLVNPDDGAIVLENLIVDNNKAVAKGYFTPFKWDEYAFGPMQFTMILTFNEQLQIVKHVDWINYPDVLLDYSKRKDSNLWINQKN